MTGPSWAAIAAVALGLNSMLVAVVARRIGALYTTAASVVIAFGFLAVYALAAQLRLELRMHDLAILMSLAAASGIAFLASYRALQLGPVAVVSPISATNGAMTVLFAFAFIGERPSASQWCGICIAAAGAVLVSFRNINRTRIALVGAGPAFAAVGVTCGAISNAGLRIPIREVGAVQAILVQRAFMIVYIWVALSCILAMARSRDQRRTHSETRRWNVALLTAVGALDALSFLSFARALTVSPAWLVGIVSQSGRAIAVVGGLLLFHERMRSHQWLGVMLLAGGLTLVVL